MFPNTLTITIDGVAKVLTKLTEQNYSSEYRLREASGNMTLKIRHSSFADKARGGRSVDRHNVEFVHTVYGTGDDPNTIRKTYFVIENDVRDTDADVVKTSLGFFGFATQANLEDLVEGQS